MNYVLATSHESVPSQTWNRVIPQKTEPLDHSVCIYKKNRERTVVIPPIFMNYILYYVHQTCRQISWEVTLKRWEVTLGTLGSNSRVPGK